MEPPPPFAVTPCSPLRLLVPELHVANAYGLRFLNEIEYACVLLIVLARLCIGAAVVR